MTPHRSLALRFGCGSDPQLVIVALKPENVENRMGATVCRLLG